MSNALEASPVSDGVRSNALATRWQAFRHDNPQVRIRDAARALGVSELELVATGCGNTATRLSADWRHLVAELYRLGPVMALTRNDHVVHEKIGSYGRLSHSGAMGTLQGAIDLRLSFSRWHHGFAVREESPRGVRESLQFFDASGTAVHKVYLTSDSTQAAYAELVERYRSPDQGTAQPVLPVVPALVSRPDEQIDTPGLLAHWQALQDTHDFNDLLKRFGVDRLQALRLAGKGLAHPVGVYAPRRLLEQVAVSGIDIMLFVASPGVVQIHTGPVHKLKALGPWFNVLDDTFSLHLREDEIASAWVVRKPTRDGTLNSLEVFAGDGGLICQLFGRRKPGQVEDPQWCALLDGLCQGGSA